jgi:hypothetical protein
MEQIAKPAATAAIFCSATPISKNLSGNSFSKRLLQVDSDKSADNATTFLFFLPAKRIPSP